METYGFRLTVGIGAVMQVRFVLAIEVMLVSSISITQMKGPTIER